MKRKYETATSSHHAQAANITRVLKAITQSTFDYIKQFLLSAKVWMLTLVLFCLTPSTICSNCFKNCSRPLADAIALTANTSVDMTWTDDNFILSDFYYGWNSPNCSSFKMMVKRLMSINITWCFTIQFKNVPVALNCRTKFHDNISISDWIILTF